MISIFNDVIGPVMRGASSSHCAAALRIGRLARDLMGGDISHVLIEFDVHGSLPNTHQSQGSDMGLFGGLLGWDAADARLPMSAAHLRAAGVAVEIRYIDCHDPHPNTYRLTLSNAHEQHTMIAISTGGGMIEVLNIDGEPVSLDGGARVTIGERVLQQVLPVQSHPQATLPFRTCAELLAHDAGRNIPLWQWAVEYEKARGALTDEAVHGMMLDIVRILRRSIAEGVAGTTYDDRLLGHQSGMFASAMQRGTLLNAGALNRTVLYTTALMEVKSSMGVIVAAPTAGACAALPASCMAVAEEMGAARMTWRGPCSPPASLACSSLGRGHSRPKLAGVRPRAGRRRRCRLPRWSRWLVVRSRRLPERPPWRCKACWGSSAIRWRHAWRSRASARTCWPPATPCRAPTWRWPGSMP